MKKVLVVLFLCILMLTACLTDSKQKPPIDFDSAYLNQQIQLVADPRLNTFKTSDPVGLRLLYKSENDITFPDNFNIKIYVVQDGNWLEIPEKPTIRSGEKVVLSPKIPISYGQLVMFYPKLDDLAKEYQMRAYVFGDMSTSEGTKQVAAFVDFVLKP